MQNAESMEGVLFEIAKQPPKVQAAFIDGLQAAGIFSDDEITALQIGIAYYHMLMQPEIKKAAAAAMYEFFTKEGQ